MLAGSKWAAEATPAAPAPAPTPVTSKPQETQPRHTVSAEPEQLPPAEPEPLIHPAEDFASQQHYSAYPSYDDPPQPPAEDDLFDDEDDYDAYEEDEPNNAAPAALDNAHSEREPAAAAPSQGAPSAHDQPAVGEFAQTRPPDDLFGDDFTPNPEPLVEHVVPVPSNAPAGAPTGPRNAARGRGSSRRGGTHTSTSRQPQLQAQAQTLTQQQQQPGQLPQKEPAASTEPNSADEPPRAQPVRGDRLATGGNARPKLTEEELTARMAAIKLKNASLEAAHARASADEAAFALREKEAKVAAAERAREERQNRQQMMGEREKNRARKLKSMASRDWEAGKEEREAEEDKRSGKGFKRGAHGGVLWEERGARSEGSPGAEEGKPEGDAVRGAPRGRGRGRGGRGGGASGRGGAHSDTPAKTDAQTKQSVPTDADFPTLAGTQEAPAKLDTQKHKATTSWADQMESPTVAKA